LIRLTLFCSVVKVPTWPFGQIELRRGVTPGGVSSDGSLATVPEQGLRPRGQTAILALVCKA